MASAAASGSVTVTPTPPARPASTAELRTRVTYRNLQMRGLAPDEAANLTAFLAGIPLAQSGWTLRQVNELLFLRALHRAGQPADGAEPRPH